MSEENNMMDLSGTEASSSTATTPAAKRPTGRARHGQRARKMVVMRDEDDDTPKQSTSGPGCGWERIYQNQAGKSEDYLANLDDDAVINIASDTMSTLALVREKQRVSSRGAPPFVPKSEKKEKAGSSTPSVDKSSAKKSKPKRAVIESRSPSPRPRTPSLRKNGDDSDADLFMDDLFETDSDSEAKKAKEEKIKAKKEREDRETKEKEELRQKEKMERRKEKEEKKKAKEERRREKEERKKRKELKANGPETSGNSKNEQILDDSIAEVEAVPSPMAEPEKVDPEPEKAVEDIAAEAQMDKPDEDTPEPAEKMDTAPVDEVPVKAAAAEASLKDNEDEPTKEITEDTTDAVEKEPEPMVIDETEAVVVQQEEPSKENVEDVPEASMNETPEQMEVTEKLDEATERRQILKKYKSTDKIKVTVPLLSEEDFTKLKSSILEQKARREERKLEKAAKERRKEERIAKKRPASPASGNPAKVRKRSESPPSRFGPSSDSKSAPKRIVTSESPSASPRKPVETAAPENKEGYDSDSQEGDIAQPQRKIPNKKVVEDRTCYTCKRDLLECESDWSDLLGSNSGYCSVQCIDDRVAHTFRLIGDPEFKVMLISRENLVMPEGVALNQLAAYIRESAHYDIIMPEKSQLPKKDLTSEAKATKHLSKDSDALRLSFKKSMIDSLTNRVSKSGCGKTFRVKDCKDMAEKLEMSLFKHSKLNVMNPRYKLWVKHFNTQVKDMKNKGFFHRVLSGDLSVHLITSIDPEKLSDAQYSAPSEDQKRVEIPGLGDGTARNRIPMRIPRKSAAVVQQSVSSTLDALLGDGSDTTEQHQSHMFDANCKICCNNQKTAAQAEKKEQEERVKAREDERKRKELRKTLVGMDEPESHRNREDDVFLLDRRDPLNLTKPTFDSPRSDDDYAGGAGGDDDYAPVHSSDRDDDDDGSKTPDSVGEIWAKRAKAREASWRKSPSAKEESSATKTPRESPWERPDIWRGQLTMAQASFVSTMTAVSNTAAFEMRENSELPAVIRVKGRISPVIVFDYLTDLRSDLSKDVIVVRLERPEDPEEKKHFMFFFDDMTSKDRHLVVDISDHPTIKDAYLMALPICQEAPAPLLPWRGPGISVDHSEMIIGVFVRYKRQLMDIQLTEVTETNKEAEPKKVEATSTPVAPYNGPAPGGLALSATNISNLTSIVSKMIAARNSGPGGRESNEESQDSQTRTSLTPTTNAPSTSAMSFAPVPAPSVPVANPNDTLIPTQFLTLFQQNREREAAVATTPKKQPTIHPNDIHSLADLIMFIQSSTSGPKVIKGVVAKFIQNPRLTEQDKAVIRKKVFEKIQAEKMKRIAQAQGGEASPCISAPDSEASAPMVPGMLVPTVDRSVPQPVPAPMLPFGNQPAAVNQQIVDSSRDDGEEEEEDVRPFSPPDFDNCERPTSFLDRAGDLLEKLTSSLQKSQVGKPPEAEKPANGDGQDETMSDQADAGSSTDQSRSNTPLVLTIASTPEPTQEQPREPPKEAVPPPPKDIPPPPPPASLPKLPSVHNIPPPPSAPVPQAMRGVPVPPKIPPPPQRAVPLPLPAHLIPPAAPVLQPPPPPASSLHSSMPQLPPGGIPPPPPTFGVPSMPPIPPTFGAPTSYMNGPSQDTSQGMQQHYQQVPEPTGPTGIPVIGVPNNIAVIGVPTVQQAPLGYPQMQQTTPTTIIVAPPPPPPPTQFRESHGSAGFGGLAPSLGVAPIPPELQHTVPEDCGTLPGFGNSKRQFDPRYLNDNVPRTPTPSGSEDEEDSPPEKIQFGGVLLGRRPGTNRRIFPGARVFIRPPSPDQEDLMMIEREERKRLKNEKLRLRKEERRIRFEQNKLNDFIKQGEQEKERQEELEQIQEKREQNRMRRENMETYWTKLAEKKRRREERHKTYPQSVQRLGLGKLRKTCTVLAKNYRIRLVSESDGVSLEEATKIVEEQHILRTDEECTTDSDADGTPANLRRRNRGGKKERARREAQRRRELLEEKDLDEEETLSEIEERRERVAYDRKRGHTTSSVRIAKMARAMNVEEDDQYPEDNYDDQGYSGYDQYNGPYRGYDDESSRSTSAAPGGPGGLDPSLKIAPTEAKQRPDEPMDVDKPAQKAPYNTFTEMPTPARKQDLSTPNSSKPSAPYMQYNPSFNTPNPKDSREEHFGAPRGGPQALRGGPPHPRGGAQAYARGGGPEPKEPWRREGPPKGPAGRDYGWSQDRGCDDWSGRKDVPCREYEGGYDDYGSFNDDYQRYPPAPIPLNAVGRGRGRGAPPPQRGGRGRGRGEAPARGAPNRGRGRGAPAAAAYDHTPNFFGTPGPDVPPRGGNDRPGYGHHEYGNNYHDYNGGYDDYGGNYGRNDGYYGSGYEGRNAAPSYSQQYEQPFSGYNASLDTELPRPRNPPSAAPGYGYGHPPAQGYGQSSLPPHPYGSPAVPPQGKPAPGPQYGSPAVPVSKPAGGSNSLLMQPPPPPPPPPPLY